MRDLRQEYRNKLLEDNAPIRMQALVDDLFVHPMMNVIRAAEQLHVSKPTARSYLERLARMGVLIEIERPYRKAWIAPQVIEVIDG